MSHESFDPQLLLQALDEAADFVVVTDDTPVTKNGPLVVYANRAVLETTGFGRDELVGHPFSMLLSPRNPTQVRDSIVDALEMRKPNYKEMLALRKDGTDFWIEFVAKPFWQHNGREYWLSIARDITMRRQALSQMALLFAAIENTADAVTLYEPDVNGALELTYQNEEAYRRGDGRLLHLWNDPSPLASVIREQLEAGRETHEYFAELDKDGLPRLVQFNARAVRSDSRIEGIVTLERTLASSGEGHTSEYQSLLLRISAVLPALASATNPSERFSILRAILLDAFEAELAESATLIPAQLTINAATKSARFALDGKSMIVHWEKRLESSALTGMRYCIEAAIEQAHLPQSRLRK